MCLAVVVAVAKTSCQTLACALDITVLHENLAHNGSLSINLSRELNILLIQAGISKPGNLLFQTVSRGKSVLE